MRSLYFRIVLASLLTVVVSLVAFIAITRVVIGTTIAKEFSSAYALQLEQAVEAYNSGGVERLAASVSRLDTAFGFEHHVTDASGRDLITGESRASMFPAGPSNPEAPRRIDGRLVFVRSSADGRYRLIVSAPPPFSGWTFAPYYLLVLASIAFASWLVAVGIASPLRTLSGAVEQFGQGDLSVRVSYTGKNEIGRLAGSFNDMAERIQTLLTAERRLLQDVGHELRSPLARLNFAVELSRTALNRDRAVDRIQNEVDRLSTLVGELLEVTRAEGDPAARTMDLVVLTDVVSEVVHACGVEAQARDSRIVLRSASSAQVRGDRELLRRAVENVLRNAIRFAPPGTDVDVDVRDEGRLTAIVIRDRGEGVPDDSLTKIFESFYRVDSSRDTKTGGLGLGLAIAQRAVHLHHGTIAAENVTPGLRVTLAVPTQAT